MKTMKIDEFYHFFMIFWQTVTWAFLGALPENTEINGKHRKTLKTRVLTDTLSQA